MVRRTALVGFLLLALFSSVVAGQVLLLHGWHGASSNWKECIRVMTSAPYSIDPQRILSPSLANEASLVDWTVNVAQYIDSLPNDSHLTVIAHSFAGTSVLFLLVIARHVEEGDLGAWAVGLSNKDKALLPIVTSFLAVSDFDLFARAASKVKAAFLYHPALGGGCLACSACGEVPVPLVCDDAVRDMCLLQTGKEDLFNGDQMEALVVPVVDIYGTRAWCLGQCFGASDTDGIVSVSDQRLFVSADNYHEIDGGAVCHIDFILNGHHAAEDLVKIVFARKASLASSQ